MSNSYVGIKDIEGVKYIAIGKPTAMLDVLFTMNEAREMLKELEAILPPEVTSPQWGGGNVPT